MHDHQAAPEVSGSHLNQPKRGVVRVRHAALPRLHALQALRFVAAFAVMVHHSLTAFGPPLTDVVVGAAGVDIFFVISGVVIGYADHDDGALRFAAKRVIRVIPLYWLATLVYGIFRYYAWHEDPTCARCFWSPILRGHGCRSTTRPGPYASNWPSMPFSAVCFPGWGGIPPWRQR